jgi:hypothetical protein
MISPIKATYMKRYLFPFWILVLVLAGIFAIFSFNAPVKKLAQWRLEHAPEEDNEIENKRIANDQALKDLTHYKIFLKNRLQMAKSDSINLVVNLRDSLVSIELKGVTLHSARIESYDLPTFFSAIDINTLNKVFSKPSDIVLQESNVDKKPLTIKKAPKSPDEVSSHVELPDTSLNIPVFVKLNIDSLFTLTFKPVFAGQKDYKKTMRKEIWNERMRVLKTNWGSILRGKVPGYMPNVEVYLASPDIVGMYRALPTNAQMAFMWP